MFDAKELLNVLTGGVPGSGRDPAAAAADALERGKQAASEAANSAAAAVSGALGQAKDRLEGTEAAGYVGKAKDVVDQNPLGAVAALGGLAAVLLGTRGGRAVTGGAVKLGGLAAIGGIAYKAFQNYQAGRPLTEGVPGLEQLTSAPEGSGFAETAHSNDSALLLVRAMIATAAADGVVDPAQRARILGELKEGGLNPQAAEFLDAEIARPSTVADIALGVGSSKELALQAYTAAHLVAESAPEKAFLNSLAEALALDPKLVGQLDAAVLAIAPTSH
ncbi:tellurite resistance TerB family protein [Methylocapsa palsarum]|uniref:Uncharacterized membrane protein YebE, DUF533 family n=1 Tax=Methylocapsa palsarum TaxID=1612308 RepID=A0A1I3VTD5_9HYPH|nr:DUF533 domain-containing protein [Methylocapsa palsarum]SFJ98183.1 Uncharacterized membrane protein YebE, DUF533 family [Methylocapsa palsarum]